MDWDAPTTEIDLGETLSLIQRPDANTRLSAAEASAPIGRLERLDRLRAALERNGTRDIETVTRLVDFAGRALAKAAGEMDPSFTRGEFVALEAVILTDGSRPSLSVADGFVDTFAPEALDWGVGLRMFEGALRRVVAATGRITIPVGPRLIGTCLLVGDGLVLTNRHVAEAIAVETAGAWRLNWPDQTLVNFQGEAEAPGQTSHVVTAVVAAGPEAIGREIDFTRLDLALLAVTPLPGADRPGPAALCSSPDIVAGGRDICLVGFPSRPREHFGADAPAAQYELASVMTAVFGDTFGVKKIAPGRVVEMPVSLGGEGRAVFAHDASTLTGSSGSVIVDLGEKGARVLGVHFGGVARGRNYAHDLPALSTGLDWMLPWQPPRD